MAESSLEVRNLNILVGSGKGASRMEKTKRLRTVFDGISKEGKNKTMV